MVGVPGKFFAILSGADGSVTVCGSVAKEMPGDFSPGILYRCRDVMQNLDGVAEHILMHLAG